jgi:hypothetical protein
MSRKVLKKSFLNENEAEENKIRRKDVPWSNPNERQQGPGKSGTQRVVGVSPTRHQDTSPGSEALSGPERRHPVCVKETLPGAVVVPGIDSAGLTVEEAYDEQTTIASHDQLTVQITARVIEENRMRREQDQIRHERDQILREQDQLRRENDQFRQILDNAPNVTPVVAPNRDVEKGDENIHVNRDDLPRRDDPKCDPGGRRWFAIGAILLIVVAIAVALALVLPSEPTPSDPTTTAPTAEPTTTAPTAQPTTTAPTAKPTTTAPTAKPATAQNPLSELLASTSSDTEELDFSYRELTGTIPTEIGKFTKLSE